LISPSAAPPLRRRAACESQSDESIYPLTQKSGHSPIKDSRLPEMLFTSRTWVQCSNSRIFQCSNVPMLQCSNAPMLECSNARMLQCSNAPMLECSNARMFQCSNSPMSEFSNSPLPLSHNHNHP
jgi:hypothetical protein